MKLVEGETIEARVRRYGPLPVALALLRLTVPPGGAIALHDHSGPECLFVTNGILEIHRGKLASDWSPLRVEHAMYVGGSVEHATRNPSDLSGRALLVTTVRTAHLFQTIGSPS